MIRASTFAGRKVAVFGLGLSGLPTAASLVAGGAQVAAWDDNLQSREAALAAAVPIVDLHSADWSQFAALVLAPGVPLTHPDPHWTVRRAKDCGIEIIGDIELFARERCAVAPTSPFVAITGTNGKSTTTALIAHLLRRLGHDVQMGGNIGVPILDLLPPDDARIHVVEMSSFQIDLTPTLQPTVGVLLNVTPDHIDRHGSLALYAAVKERLVEGAEISAIGIDDLLTRDIAERIGENGLVYPFTVGKGAAIVPKIYAIGATLFVHEAHGTHASSTEIASLQGVPNLRGRHNVQNAAAALTALRALQDRLYANGSALKVWRPAELAAALRSFPGLPHRMEDVGNVGSVQFVNDSKATNADSADKALDAVGRDIFWIVGGKSKEGGIDALASHFPAVQRAYLIGASTDLFAATLEARVPYARCGSLEVAVAAAARDAAAFASTHRSATPVVLLSPACASYDQFRSFEHRGDTFRDLVSRLADHRPAGAVT
jgi:UDP-N-acetylmuramoylalanine--D-glutamate ligase